MGIGRSHVVASNKTRKIRIMVQLDNNGKFAESSGILVNITNDVADGLRKHFNAHEIRVVEYRPAAPAKRKTPRRVKEKPAG
jgi:hypothetical protein